MSISLKSTKNRSPREVTVRAIAEAIRILRGLGNPSPTRELIARRAARIVGSSTGGMLSFMADKLTADEKREFHLSTTRGANDVIPTP